MINWDQCNLQLSCSWVFLFLAWYYRFWQVSYCFGGLHILRSRKTAGIGGCVPYSGSCSLAFGGYSVISLIPVFRYLFVIWSRSGRRYDETRRRGAQRRERRTILWTAAGAPLCWCFMVRSRRIKRSPLSNFDRGEIFLRRYGLTWLYWKFFDWNSNGNLLN